MGVTIKDIAELAGVSAATVSHIINKTRYVSPELEHRVRLVMDETGYSAKIAEKESNLAVGKESTIAFVVPNLASPFYSTLAGRIGSLLLKEGYLMCSYSSNDDPAIEKHILRDLATNKRVGGVILASENNNLGGYTKLLTRVPFVCIDKMIGDPGAVCIVSKEFQAAYKGTLHLLKSGHTRIAVIADKKMKFHMSERVRGYNAVLEDYGIELPDKYAIYVDPDGDCDIFENTLYDFYREYEPTAFFACDNLLTNMLVHALKNTGISCPEDVSVVGFGESEWNDLTSPPLTVLERDTEKIAHHAVKLTLSILRNEDVSSQTIAVPMKLAIRKSTRVIGMGPFGEKAHSPADITITPSERQRLWDGNFRVGISFFFDSTGWNRIHEASIRETLAGFGVTVSMVTEANLDPHLQLKQLDEIQKTNPDLIISIPADDKAVAAKFREISEKTKLVFIGNIPEGMQRDEYSSCISINERENGKGLATMMSDYFGSKRVRAGFICYGSQFYGTRLRDITAQQTIADDHHNIEIAAVEYFKDIEDAYRICYHMIITNPTIDVLYVSWDLPVMEVIRALEELERNDISVFTYNLNNTTAKYLAEGKYIKGVSSLRPYEQGQAAGMAAAKALIGDMPYKYIAIPPRTVTQSQIIGAWKDIMHTTPDEIHSNEQ